MHIVYSTNNFNFKLRTLALQIILFVLLEATIHLKEDLKCVMVVSGILSVGSILIQVLQVQSVISLDLLQTIVKVIELSLSFYHNSADATQLLDGRYGCGSVNTFLSYGNCGIYNHVRRCNFYKYHDDRCHGECLSKCLGIKCHGEK